MKWVALVVLALAPLAGMGNYPLHLLITCLIWAFVYTGWAIMGRLGMVSLGHGAFLGIGAYVVVMGWNHYGLSPWLGIPLALGVTALVAFLIGYPCFRFKIGRAGAKARDRRWLRRFRAPCKPGSPRPATAPPDRAARRAPGR